MKKFKTITIRQLVIKSPADFDNEIAGARVGLRHKPHRIQSMKIKLTPVKSMKITPETDPDGWPIERPKTMEESAAKVRRQRQKFAAFRPPPPRYLGPPMNELAKQRRQEEMDAYNAFWPAK